MHYPHKEQLDPSVVGEQASITAASVKAKVMARLSKNHCHKPFGQTVLQQIAEFVASKSTTERPLITHLLQALKQ